MPVKPSMPANPLEVYGERVDSGAKLCESGATG